MTRLPQTSRLDAQDESVAMAAAQRLSEPIDDQSTRDVPRSKKKIAVVIPCFRVRAHILSVINRIGTDVDRVYVIDDLCPEQSGQYVQSQCSDPRVQVLFHEANHGVGGATITGYRQAVEDGATVIVKIDGDGQMDPQLISRFVTPILSGECDYTKGNRFFNPADVQGMPLARLLGNSALSFFSKLSSGYWLLFDPTNGYTAIHASLVRALQLDRIDKRYFFESDMLFRLNLLRALIVDIPMKAIYGTEKSNLSLSHASVSFLFKHIANFRKRLVYTYLLRDFSIASLELIAGSIILLWGICFGLFNWYQSFHTGTPASSGTVMLSALPIILGIQLLLGFLAFDIAAQPRKAIHPRLEALEAVEQSSVQ